MRGSARVFAALLDGISRPCIPADLSKSLEASRHFPAPSRTPDALARSSLPATRISATRLELSRRGPLDPIASDPCGVTRSKELLFDVRSRPTYITREAVPDWTTRRLEPIPTRSLARNSPSDPTSARSLTRRARILSISRLSSYSFQHYSTTSHPSPSRKPPLRAAPATLRFSRSRLCFERWTRLLHSLSRTVTPRSSSRRRPPRAK